MAKLICVFIVLFALGAINFATVETVQSSIIHGSPAVFGDFPSIVSITSSVGQSNCLGNVINELHVLTAASCVVNAINTLINPVWLTVTAGDLNFNQPTWRRIVRNVTTIYPHHQYNWGTGANNLAVLRVGERFPFPHNSIESVIFATQILITDCRFAGWSLTGAVINQQQQVIDVPIHSVAVCQQHNALAGMLCGGSLLQNAPSPCTGGLGGGLYCGPDNLLVGLLALEPGCGAINRPGVYIELRGHLAWINQQFARTVRFPPGTAVHQTV